MNDLAGQVALVTGGGRGIGRAIGVALAQAGAAVGLVSRSIDELEQAVREIDALSGRYLLGVARPLGRLNQRIECRRLGSLPGPVVTPRLGGTTAETI
jgi:3-oxoacyl-[acyl-carrier protein] reductase